VRRIIAALLLLGALIPRAEGAAACDYKAGQIVQVTGTYIPSRPEYTRPFVFALQLECGAKDLVTVQRATGALPVCQPKERVEVVGKLVWSKFLIDGHYEINNPSSVTCLPPAESSTTPAASPAGVPRPSGAPAIAATTPAPSVPSQGGAQQGAVQSGQSAKTPGPPSPFRVLGPSRWVGRYEDSRGSGDVSFDLVLGASTVAGTWKLRTGGGGPVTGLLDEGGRRMHLRMENLASECPGAFEGSAEISDTKMLATYAGRDCQGTVTNGTLQLRAQ